MSYLQELSGENLVIRVPLCHGGITERCFVTFNN